ncbi:MAG: Coenzyme F420 hydrogenase/dehydrogenase, beta subunit C-terminal domain, partial [Ruminococcus flavefaciens]|nr:Coenzyme F420 hydrogenase/dehydrogenase, beta subunit C-terminal domain [Ruminococcus flavefaciens]
MKIYADKKDCCGCGACREVCPKAAIQMQSDKEGFLYPHADEKKCIGCGCCETVCPLRNSTKTESVNRSYFGVQAKDEGIRYESSSGGMFPILAKYVFERQGTVYGAAYNEAMKVEHRGARNREELKQIKKTKYVQSNLEGIFKEITEQLEAGKWILFCGTPCQADALRLFLGWEYPKLILVDLICYGVSSPGVWASYVKYLERKSGGKIMDFSFRDKRNRDNGHTCSYRTGDREQAGSLYADPYCRMYFRNYIIRPSCHVCKYCTV